MSQEKQLSLPQKSTSPIPPNQREGLYHNGQNYYEIRYIPNDARIKHLETELAATEDFYKQEVEYLRSEIKKLKEELYYWQHICGGFYYISKLHRVNMDEEY